MDYELDPTTVQASYGACKILRAMWAPVSPQEAILRCFDFCGPALHSGLYAAAGLVPGLCTYRNANCSIIALGGIQAINRPDLLINSYLDESTSDATLSCNPRIHAAAVEVMTRIAGQGYLDPPTVWIIGHSYGGAIAQALGALFAGGQRDIPIRLCTFGAPRMANPYFYPRVKALARARWVTRNDPVPHAPFQPSEAPTMYGFLTARQQQRLRLYVNYMQCFQIHAGGQIYALPSSDLGPPVTESAFYSWAIGARGLTSPNHHIQAYQNALMLATIAPLPNPPTLPPVTDVPEIPERITPAVVAVINNAVNGVADDSGINRGTAVTIPQVNRATYRRAGSMYQIVWQEAVVGVAPNLRQARSMCRAINASNRTLLTLSRVESPALVNAMTNFLTAAAKDGGGFDRKLPDGGIPPIDPLA